MFMSQIFICCIFSCYVMLIQMYNISLAGVPGIHLIWTGQTTPLLFWQSFSKEWTHAHTQGKGHSRWIPDKLDVTESPASVPSARCRNRLLSAPLSNSTTAVFTVEVTPTVTESFKSIPTHTPLCASGAWDSNIDVFRIYAFFKDV